ncbi:MAG TPA: hypothetical protein VNA25_06795 [Phycisphaerae bacterium]|nr:hypothetical protein [Phycisphaerae bacterium]
MGLQEGYVAYVCKFRNHAITIIAPKREYHGPHETYDEGFTAHFQGFLFTTDEPKIIKAMDAHRKYGVTFQRIAAGTDYEQVKQFGRSPVRFSRGPATTLAEKLGAPKPVPPDTTKISDIAPPPVKAKGKGFGK